MQGLTKAAAHRGLFGNGIPENSLAAFDAAQKQGLSVELDVHILSDGNLAVVHDFNLKRMTGKDVEIETLTTADLAGDDYRLPDGSHIPLLRDVLQIVSDSGIILELKTKKRLSRALERAVLAEVRGKQRNIVLESFNPITVAYLKRYADGFRVGQLLSTKKYLRRAVSSLHPDFVALNVQAVDESAVNYLAERHIPLVLWTVRDDTTLAVANKATADTVIFEQTADWQKLL